MKQILTFSLILFFLNLQAQEPQIANSYAYGGLSSDLVNDLISSIDGGLISVGITSSNTNDFSGVSYSSDAFIIKKDASGNIEWVESVGGSQTDVFQSVIQTADGSIYAAGYSQSNNGGLTSHGNYDYLVVKFNSSGVQQWLVNYGSAQEDRAYGIHELPDGNIGVIGQTLGGYFNSNNFDVPYSNGYNGFKIWFLKLNKNTGSILLAPPTIYGTGGTPNNFNFQVRHSIKLSDGFLITGNTNNNDLSSGCIPTSSQNNIFMLKMDFDADVDWIKTFGSNNSQYGMHLLACSDGGYLISGYSFGNSTQCDFSTTNSNLEAIVVKTNSVGNKDWSKSFGGSAYDVGYSSVELIGEGYWLAGLSSSTNGDFNNIGFEDVVIWNLNYAGNLIGGPYNFGGSRAEGWATSPWLNSQGNVRIIKSSVDDIWMASSSESQDFDVPNVLNTTDKVWLVKFGEPESDFNCSWIGFVNNQSGYLEANEADCDFINNDMAYISPSLTTQNIYWTGFVNLNDFGFDADNLTIEARVRNPISQGGIDCFDTELWVLGESNYGFVAYMDPSSSSFSCEQYCAFGTGANQVNGQTSNLNALLRDFSNWVNIKIELNGTHIRTYYNNSLVYTLPYTQNLGALKGIKLAFKGSGSIDYVKLYSTDNNQLLYQDNFSDCSQNCPSCPTDVNLLLNLIPSGNYQSQNNLQLSGMINSNSHVNLKAGQEISLNPGFEVNSNGILSISIESCN